MDGGAGTATAVAIRPACLWCETAFEPRKAGSPQRFCTSKCREEFHSAGRRYAERAVLGGLLTVADLRNGSPGGAKRRRGTICQGPAMPNGRCKTHGGRSPGAPRGRQNGNWRGGFYSQESQADRRRLRELIRQMRTAMDEVP
jgi:hypothetical protein